MNAHTEDGFVDADGKCLFNKKGSELLVDLASHCGKTLVNALHIDEEQAFQIGREVAEQMASHWGGQNVYFPMGLTYKLSQRDRQIYADFTGNNHSDLVRKYGVSLQWVYKIIRTIRKEELALRQKDLFPK